MRRVCSRWCEEWPDCPEYVEDSECAYHLEDHLRDGKMDRE